MVNELKQDLPPAYKVKLDYFSVLILLTSFLRSNKFSTSKDTFEYI